MDLLRGNRGIYKPGQASIVKFYGREQFGRLPIGSVQSKRVTSRCRLCQAEITARVPCSMGIGGKRGGGVAALAPKLDVNTRRRRRLLPLRSSIPSKYKSLRKYIYSKTIRMFRTSSANKKGHEWLKFDKTNFIIPFNNKISCHLSIRSFFHNFTVLPLNSRNATIFIFFV